MSSKSLYESDFHKWCLLQASFIEDGVFELLDLKNLAEEVNSMGKGEERELDSHLIILFMHLLKWIYQPERRSKSWANSIKIQRIDVERHMEKNPSLKSYIDESATYAYLKARKKASDETGFDMDTFPESMPFTIQQARSCWLPESNTDSTRL